MATAEFDTSRPVLITGAGGFAWAKTWLPRCARAATATCCCLKRTTRPKTLAEYCRKAAFVIHLAGINRPKEASEFYSGNAGLTDTMLRLLEQAGNACPVLVTSSVQAALENDYGKSKRLAEQAILATASAPARRCMFSVWRGCSASGAAPTTTVWSPPSATTSRAGCRSRCATRIFRCRSFTLTTSSPVS